MFTGRAKDDSHQIQELTGLKSQHLAVSSERLLIFHVLLVAKSFDVYTSFGIILKLCSVNAKSVAIRK